MTQVQPQPRMTFEEFLEYDDGTDKRYELDNGVLIEVAPESDPDIRLALWFAELLRSVVSWKLIRTHASTIEVSPLRGAGLYPPSFNRGI